MNSGPENQNITNAYGFITQLLTPYSVEQIIELYNRLQPVLGEMADLQKKLTKQNKEAQKKTTSDEFEDFDDSEEKSLDDSLQIALAKFIKERKISSLSDIRALVKKYNADQYPILQAQFRMLERLYQITNLLEGYDAKCKGFIQQFSELDKDAQMILDIILESYEEKRFAKKDIDAFIAENELEYRKRGEEIRSLESTLYDKRSKIPIVQGRIDKLKEELEFRSKNDGAVQDQSLKDKSVSDLQEELRIKEAAKANYESTFPAEIEALEAQVKELKKEREKWGDARDLLAEHFINMRVLVNDFKLLYETEKNRVLSEFSEQLTAIDLKERTALKATKPTFTEETGEVWDDKEFSGEMKLSLKEHASSPAKQQKEAEEEENWDDLGQSGEMKLSLKERPSSPAKQQKEAEEDLDWDEEPDAALVTKFEGLMRASPPRDRSPSPTRESSPASDNSKDIKKGGPFSKNK